MIEKRFHIATPDQLQALAPYAKNDTNTLMHIARLWKAEKQKNVHTYWDHGVFVGFSGERQREAAIARLSTANEWVVIAQMKYDLALGWCERNLSQAFLDR